MNSFQSTFHLLQRSQVCVQCRKQFSQALLQFALRFARHQFPLIGSSQKVLHLMKRSTGCSDKSLMIRGRGTAVALGDVRTNAIRRSNNLSSNGVFRERIPSNDQIPNCVRQNFGKSMHTQVIEGKSCHGSCIATAGTGPTANY